MATNKFPGIGFRHGRDFNFYEKVDVSSTDFGSNSVSGEQPDVVFSFVTSSLLLVNEAASGVVEYSFNGITVHGELDGAGISKGLIFDNRQVSMIWFRVKPGSSGTMTVRVESWGN